MLILRHIVAALFVISCAVEAPAQRAFVTANLDIHLTGARCGDVSDVWVVMDGREREVFPARKDPAEKCHFTATRPGGTFDAELSRFSLRLGIARTGCRKAEVQRISGEAAATLVFSCCGPRTRDIEISTTEEMPLAYTRAVAKDPHDPKSLPCEESYSDYIQPVKILSVWYAGVLRTPSPAVETVRVEFGERDAKRKVPLLIFNDASVTKYLSRPESVLSAAQILAAGREQRAKGEAGAPPLLSPAADDAERARLKQIGLKRVTVKQAN
jgi:hypothetical protein